MSPTYRTSLFTMLLLLAFLFAAGSTVLGQVQNPNHQSSSPTKKDAVNNLLNRVPDPENPGLEPSAGTMDIPKSPDDVEITLLQAGSTLWSGANSVTIRDNYAYCAYYYGLLIVDISNPSNPVKSSQLYLEYGQCMDVVVSGDYAYTANWEGGLKIIDISTPSLPELAGYIDTDGLARGIDVSGAYAFVADGEYGLQVFDISNPSYPTHAGGYDTDGEAKAVTVIEMTAYVADGSSGLQIIDVSELESIYLITSYDTPDTARAVVVSGDYAYIADDQSGLQIVNISSLPSPPTYAGSYDATGRSYDLQISGDFVFVSG